MKQIFSFSERVRKEANELDKLPGTALTAVLGGSIVLGVVAGGLFWIPAAMSGSMFVYRLAVTAIEYPSYRTSRRIQDITQVRLELENINESSLPITVKEQLSQCAVKQLPSLSLPAKLGQVIEHQELDKD